MSLFSFLRKRGAPDRLHVGCGTVILPGWINVDREPGKGVDHILGIRRSLPFANLSRIFAEHFLEHLTEEEGAGFLRDCFRALSNGGRIRLSTPSLDWVVMLRPRLGSGGCGISRCLFSASTERVTMMF
jgi:predicted SAM-dependent methyltransferase